MKVTSTLLVLSLGLFAVMPATPVKENKRLIKTSEQDPGTWMTEAEMFTLLKSHKGFVDITENRDFSLEKVAPQNVAAVPSNPRFGTVVNDLLRTANRTLVEDFLREFSDFFNRHYNSQYGVESEKFLLGEILSVVRDNQGNATTREVEHTWPQNSIIARIEGSDPQLRSEVVILGAHEDSTAGGASARSPGADDNGSGSAVVLEVFRILQAAGFRSKRSMEFHWYAAEEAGLLGSAAIARQYKADNVTVAAMLNLDVVGWQAAGINDVGVFTDNGNADVIQFVRQLVDEYLTYGRRDRSCGYGCSDHASWTSQGYPAAFAAEYQFHPNMHTARDDFASVGFTQVMEFVKLAVGFVVEVAEPL